MKYAIVLGTGVVALGTIREYATVGIPVIHVSGKKDDIAGVSNKISRRVFVPFSAENTQPLFDLLVEQSHEWQGALIDPVNDPYIVFIAQNHEALSQHYRLAVQTWDKISGIIEKHRLYQLSHDIGVPAPRIYHPDQGGSLDECCEQFEFPCIIKPTQTPAFFATYGTKVLVVNNPSELLPKYEDVTRRQLDVMVSEIIKGDVLDLYIYICYRNDDGDILAEMCVQKIRQKPQGFGVGSVIRTVPMIGELKRSALKLLEASDYTGMSATEFKRDQGGSGDFKLIEINTRAVLYERIFSTCGINFREILFYDKVYAEKRTCPDYRKEVYWIHQFDELSNFSHYLKKKVTLTSRTFFEPYFKSHVYAVPLFSDPRPFLKMVRKVVLPMVRNQLRKLFARSNRR